MKRIIYFSGPSGVGKTKLKEKLENLAGPLGFSFERVVASTSRKRRPHERQGDPWYFRSAAEIAEDHSRDPDRFLRIEVRDGEPQGLDAEKELRGKLARTEVLWCELHWTWLPEIERWVGENLPGTRITKVFLSPLSEAEISGRMARDNASREKVIEEEMLRRLLARRDAGLDNSTDEKIRVRARDGAKACAAAGSYDVVIVNHQSEDSPEWGAPLEFPTGEAARVFEQVLSLWGRTTITP